MKRLFKFWLTSLSGTIVDMFFLFILSRYVFKTDFIVYYIAPIISFEFAMFNNFNISHYWVWKDRHVHGFYFKKLYKYNLACFVGFSVKMIFLIFFKILFRFDVLLCNLLGLCFSFLVNYLAGEKLIFKKIKLEEDNAC